MGCRNDFVWLTLFIKLAEIKGSNISQLVYNFENNSIFAGFS